MSQGILEYQIQLIIKEAKCKNKEGKGEGQVVGKGRKGSIKVSSIHLNHLVCPRGIQAKRQMREGKRREEVCVQRAEVAGDERCRSWEG